jgi:hypothetical protein
MKGIKIAQNILMENRVAKKPLENIFILGIFKKCGVRSMGRIFVTFD